MCVLAMMKTVVAYLIVYPRRSVLYGLFGILGLSMVLLAINDKNWRPLKSWSRWTVTSNYSLAGAHYAIDRDLKNYWSSYLPMTFGMYFQVDIGAPSVVNGLILHVGKERQGQPVKWVVKTSLDGKHWQTPISRKSIPYRLTLVIPFEPVRARYVQIIQTSIASSPSPWLIHELEVLQPVVPWQFDRSTLVFWILGVLFVIVTVVVFSGENTPLAPLEGGMQILLPVIMILIIVAGWVLRVYDITSYELSEPEFQYFPGLAFGKYGGAEWIKAYFDHSKTGMSWLTLFLIRWVYRFCESQLAAIRMIPAIWGVGAVFLVFFVWKMFSEDGMAIWEAIMASAFVSFSGFYVSSGRIGDLTIPLFFFLLLYLLVAYTFLYKRGSYLFAPFLTVLLGVGFFFHPAMGLLPVGVILWSIFHLLLCKFRPRLLRTHHLQLFRLKHNALRLVVYIISVLPLYGYWFFFVKEGNLRNIVSDISLNSFDVSGLSQALHFAGLTGVVTWIFWGLVLVGVLQVAFGQSHSEWWFFLQGGLFFLVIAVCSPKDSRAAICVLILLLFLLFVRGILSSLSFLCPRISDRQRLFIRAALFLGVAVYIGIFALNSLFFGRPGFPYAPGLYAGQAQAHHISELIRQVTHDPDPCKTVVMRDQQLVDHYASEYSISSNFIRFPDLQRSTAQGIFQTYLFVPVPEAAENQIVADFLARYYTEIGKTSRMFLYQLQEEFHNSPQRYTSKDLYHNTGHHREDKRSSSGIVRFGTPDDQPGLLTFGPFCRVCRSGRYIVRFVLRALDTPDDVVARLEVGAANQDSLALRELKGTDFANPKIYQTFDLPVNLDLSDTPAYQMDRLQFFIHFTGKTEVRVDYIELIPEKVL